MTGSGSFSTEMGCPHHVRFTPLATANTSLVVRFVRKSYSHKHVVYISVARCFPINSPSIVGEVGDGIRLLQITPALRQIVISQF
jgi:hypothetical protein